MKLKNIELIDYVQTLSEFGEKQLPQKIAYAIMRNAAIVKKDIDIYYSSLEKIIDKYSEWIEKDDEGNQVILSSGIPKVDDEYMENYVNDINELVAIEIDVDLYHIPEELFNYDDSGKYDVLSAADITRLKRVICE